MNGLLIMILLSLSAFTLGFMLDLWRQKNKRKGARQTAEQIIHEAHRDATDIIKDAQVKAKDELIRYRDAFETEVKHRRLELTQNEDRFAQREHNLDRKIALLDKKEQQLEEKIEHLEHHRLAVREKEKEALALIEEQQQQLEHIANLSTEEAKKILLNEMELELQSEFGQLIQNMQDEAKATAEKNARKILTLAIERYAAEQVNHISTSSIHLPSNDMKGRIIGKEGRNIRALEATTGINILIDETPETVVISGFDPIRREIAKLALERLIADGRIHPGTIENSVSEVKQEIETSIQEAGNNAVLKLGLHGVAPEIIYTLGKLKYRHSFAQNVLAHSIETAYLMNTLASELHLDARTAKRIGLFHDIGKAIDHDIDGSHALIGADLLRKHGEDPIVVNAVAAHHGEVEKESLYANLVVAADAITAARPGARSESTELYIKRLTEMEEVANAFRGVLNSYAIQAGRELRVIVEPSKIDDHEAMQIARDISKQIQDQMNYPGQIKVTVIRETRCIEYAK